MKVLKLFLIPATIISLALLVGFTAPVFVNYYHTPVKGNGKIVTDERQLSDFNKIDLSGAFYIVLNKGEVNQVKIETDENILKYVKSEVEKNTLKLFLDKTVTKPTKLNVTITYKELVSLESSGASKITGNSEISCEQFSLKTTGASDIKLTFSVKELNTNSSGAGCLNLSGFADKQNIDLSGAATYNAFELLSNFAKTDLSGACTAKINVKNEINGELSGACSIQYKGNIPVKNVSITGVGSISKSE